jgi:lysyl-tRNA synthetase class I
MPLDNDDIKQLIAILQKGLSTNTDPKEDDIPEEQAPIKTKRKTRATSSPNQNKVNKFDNMREKNLHKEDVEIDKVLSRYPPTNRSREFSMIDVTCRVCGRKEEINPALLYDAPNRYKCNRCSKEPG